MQIKIQADSVELVSTSSLTRHPKNMNVHTDEQIERLIKLIEYQGWRNPLIVQKGTNHIVAGNGRHMAAEKMGLEKVPVLYQEFTDEAQLYSYIVSDNAINADQWGGGLDLSQINKDIIDLGPDLDIDMLGLKDFVIEPIEKLDPQSDEDEVPEVENPITKRGDVWLLGEHRLMCADSCDPSNIEKVLNGKKAELVFTDPPYRMQVEGGSNQMAGKAAIKLGEAIKHLCDFEPAEFLDSLPLVFDKNKMNAYIFCNKDLVPDYLNWGVGAGYSFNILFWKKPNAIPPGGSHRPDVEYLLLFRRSATWNNGLKNVSYSKCLEFGRDHSEKHPTMKPVELIDNEILISSTAGQVVFEFFTGSGSTMISCEKNNRLCYGLELDEKYCDIAINRWQNYTGKEAILESTGETYNALKQKAESIKNEN